VPPGSIQPRRQGPLRGRLSLLFRQSFVGERSNFNFIPINANISRTTTAFVAMSGSDLIMIP
jgi:hypothetical protein